MKFFNALRPSKVISPDYCFSSHGNNPIRNRNLSSRSLKKQEIETDTKAKAIKVVNPKDRDSNRNRKDVSTDHPEEDDGTTATASNSSLSGSSTSNDLNDIDFGEILQCGSADSYFMPTSISFASGEDDRDGPEELALSDGDGMLTSISNDVRDGSERSDQGSLSSPVPSGSRPPRPPQISSVASQSSSETSPRTKALPLRELRRTASEKSKMYIHVYHNQLSTLFEEEDEDDNKDTEENIFDDENRTDGIYESHSFMASFDEDVLRQRWNDSLKKMKAMGVRTWGYVQQGSK